MDDRRNRGTPRKAQAFGLGMTGVEHRHIDYVRSAPEDDAPQRPQSRSQAAPDHLADSAPDDDVAPPCTPPDVAPVAALTDSAAPLSTPADSAPDDGAAPHSAPTDSLAPHSAPTDGPAPLSAPTDAGPAARAGEAPTAAPTPTDGESPAPTAAGPNPDSPTNASAPPMSQNLSHEIAAGSDPDSPIRQRVAAWRAKVAAHPQWRGVYRTVIAAVGGVIVVIGIVLLAIPGPGWLCIFLGLGVLSTEFIWARRISDRLRRILAWATAHWHAFRARRKERKQSRAQAKAEARTRAQAKAEAKAQARSRAQA